MTVRPPGAAVSRARRLLLTLVAVGCLAVALAPPAAAHIAGATTNFRSFFTNGGSECLAWSVLSGDGFLRLRSSCAATVTVLGYEGEPYLQFSPAFGVRENRNSPAAYLNRDARADVEIPAGVTADAAPDWVSRGGLTSMIWHDHRTHWMASSPPRTQARTTRINTWSIPMQFDEDGTGVFVYGIEATGELWYDRPEVAWWSVALAAAAATAVLAAGLGRRRVDTAATVDRPLARVVAFAVGAVSLLTVAGVVDDLQLDGQTAGRRTVDVIVAVVVLGAAAWAVWRARRGDRGGFVALVVAGAALAGAFGWRNRAQLSASQLLGSLPDPLIRLTTALQFAVGALTVAALVAHLRPWHRRPPPEPVTA